jgi:hypothetical protein
VAFWILSRRRDPSREKNNTFVVASSNCSIQLEVVSFWKKEKSYKAELYLHLRLFIFVNTFVDKRSVLVLSCTRNSFECKSENPSLSWK